MNRDTLLPLVAAVFRTHGFAGASITRITAATGLGKASLYHHFPQGKNGMLMAVIAKERRLIAENILSPLHDRSQVPYIRLQRWAEALRAHHKQSRACLLGTLVLSGGCDVADKELHAAFDEHRLALVRTLEDATIPSDIAVARAAQALERIQGALLMAKITGDTDAIHKATRRLPAELLRAL